MDQSITRFEKLFVVMDPTRMIQPALLRGERIAAKENASLLLYSCVYDERLGDDEAEQQIEIDLTREWLERLAVSAREKGLEVDLQVEWNSDWRRAVLAAAEAAECGLVIKTASQHSAIGRRLMKTSDWLLLSECAEPVLLVSGNRRWTSNKLLAAVKLKPQDEAHQRMNERLVDLSHTIATQAGFDRYAVTAYKGGEDFFYDRQQFADLCRLPRDRVFSNEGPPERVIAAVAEDIKPDVIVIGNPGGATRNTAHLLIDQVETDVLVLPDS